MILEPQEYTGELQKPAYLQTDSLQIAVAVKDRIYVKLTGTVIFPNNDSTITSRGHLNHIHYWAATWNATKVIEEHVRAQCSGTLANDSKIISQQTESELQRYTDASCMPVSVKIQVKAMLRDNNALIEALFTNQEEDRIGTFTAHCRVINNNDLLFK